MHESEKWKWNRSVVSTLSDPMDCSLPGSSAHGIFQARVLEWGAIAFSGHMPWGTAKKKKSYIDGWTLEMQINELELNTRQNSSMDH